MLEARHVAAMSDALKRVRVPASDIEASKDVSPPRNVTSGRSRLFAAMGAAILEKMCRVGGLRVRSRRTIPYVIDTPRGRVALSVMVSAIVGDPAVKHLVVPVTSLRVRRVVDHVVVAAFVSKFERIRERNGGLETCLAGWLPASDLRRLATDSRVFSLLGVLTVPVSRLRSMSEFKEYIEKGENE